MGILRFLLALSVIASHASGISIPMPDGCTYSVWTMHLIDGRESVVLFYIISGFYMAMILNTKYSNHTLKFYLNRFLRLWPTYIIVFILACFFTPVGSYLITTLSECSLLIKSYVWLANILILGTDTFWLFSIHDCNVHYLPALLNTSANGASYLVNAPAFSISIEIIFYLMAPFILKSLTRTWIYFFLGVLYHFYFIFTGHFNIIFQYHLFPSSFLYFGLGALAWQYSKNLNFKLTEIKVIGIFLTCILLMFTYSLFPMIIVLSITLMVPTLFNITKHSKADRLIGEMSYSLYIVHYPVLTFLWGQRVPKDLLGIRCFCYTLLISVLIHFLVERPIDKLRQRSISNS